MELLARTLVGEETVLARLCMKQQQKYHVGGTAAGQRPSGPGGGVVAPTFPTSRRDRPEER
jgi:hypothetical protein